MNDNIEYQYVIKFSLVNSLDINNKIEPSENEQTVKHEWFKKLEFSILEKGIINPILLIHKNNDLYPRYGGSRAMIAQRYNMWIKAIVADYTNSFPGNILPYDPTYISRYFKNPPKKIILKEDLMNISGCEDFHMK